MLHAADTHKNRPVLNLLCYIDLGFIVIPHLHFCVRLDITVKCSFKVASYTSVEYLVVFLVSDVTYSQVIHLTL